MVDLLQAAITDTNLSDMKKKLRLHQKIAIICNKVKDEVYRMEKKDYYAEKHARQRETALQLVAELPDVTHKFFNEYCRVLRTFSERTIIEYAKDLRIYFKYLLETNPALDNDMNNITPEILGEQTAADLQDFISHIAVYQMDGESRSNSPSGLNRKVAALRTFYKYLCSMGHIPHNPSEILAAPRRHEKEVIWLDRDESDDLLTTVSNPEIIDNGRLSAWSKRTMYRDKAILVLLLGTGLRVSECVGLNLSDINWKNRSARIVRKGGKEQTIYFNKDVEDALKDYIQLERLSPEDGSNALFISRKKNRMSIAAIERMVKKYASVAVPQKKITAHKLRATFASQLGQATNGNLSQIRKALGHSSLEMSRRYVGVSDREIQLVSALATWTHVFDLKDVDDIDNLQNEEKL